MPIAGRHIARGGLPASAIRGLENPNPWTRTLYVSSTHSRASDLMVGTDREHPLATLKQAVAVARVGDLIIVAPAHAETVNAADYIDFNLVDLTVRGIGNGDRRPKFTFDTTTAADLKISAAGVTLENLNLVTGLASVVQLIDVAAADAALIDMAIHESGSGTVLDAIVLATSSHRCVIAGLQARQPTAGGQSCIQFPAANDVTIEGCDITGDYAVAAIENGAAATQCVIAGNLLESVNAADTCITMHASTTGRIADNRCRIATDAQTTWIVAAAMDWFENYGVNNVPSETGKIIGTASA